MPFGDNIASTRTMARYWDVAGVMVPAGDGRKHLIVQTRSIYGFCTAYRLSGKQEYLDAAAQGAAFFRKYFRDEKNGAGCEAPPAMALRSISRRTFMAPPLLCTGCPNTIGVSHDGDALQDAVDTYGLVSKYAWDKEHGALYDDMTPDWKILHSTKRADTQMHTMESMSSLYAATGDDRYLQMLTKLVEAVLGPMHQSGFLDVAHDCIQERFSADWQTQVDDMYRDRTIYGHLVEALAGSSRCWGRTSRHRYTAQGQRLIEHALRYGMDLQRGGIYHLGTPRGEVTITNKIWWPQEELLAMLSSATARRASGATSICWNTEAAYVERGVRRSRIRRVVFTAGAGWQRSTDAARAAPAKRAIM